MNYEKNQIEQLQKKIAQLSVLYSIGAGIGLTPDPNEVLEFVLDKAMGILRAEIGVILLLDEGPGTLSVSHARGLNKKLMEQIRIQPGEAIAGKVAQTGAMELVNDLQKQPELADVFLQHYSVQAVVCLPIKIRDKIRGVVHFSRLSNLKFEPDDVWILTILTQRANMALESAELYQNLQKSEKRFKDIAFSSADWIWEVDAKGVYTYCSEKVEELLGYQREEIIGKTLFDFIPPEDADKLRVVFGQIIQNREQIKDLENWNLSKNGRRICFLTNGVPILDERNQLIGYRGVAKDITDRKQAEIKLKEIMEDLKRSNIELEQFAFIASHDLQEPLRKIRMYSDKLQDTYSQVLDEKAVDYLQRMNSAAARLETLIQGLLEYSRVSTKIQPFEPIDLNEFIKEVLGDMEVRITETNAKIIIETLPTMNGDPLQMRQLFQNLIGNAIKYHRESVAPVIRIQSRMVKESSQDYYEIRVIDNGIGFDNIYAEKIFGLFQRLHGRNEYEGAGLGLSICRKIVTRHGGYITANSQPGEGSTFIIRLPVNYTGSS